MKPRKQANEHPKSDEDSDKLTLVDIYMFKVNNGNTETRCEICSKLANGIVLVSLLLTFNQLDHSKTIADLFESFHYLSYISLEEPLIDNICVICGALRDLVPFVQFEKREKHPLKGINFSKATS